MSQTRKAESKRFQLNMVGIQEGEPRGEGNTGDPLQKGGTLKERKLKGRKREEEEKKGREKGKPREL
ncbi:uncharacterized protein N7511_004995 [Penicillium nucicola]|uniref:uncharacterized protein n=1 Tax=Penicillium nucicola TaxID=1850975 RepID=UPI0025459EC0|nr:uncharacterized protein N7511_004995 [Penicillium nucicola]KAJ5767379.1 hypothetical protein N7511_004995 [Penicillium nucicola]